MSFALIDSFGSLNSESGDTRSLIGDFPGVQAGDLMVFMLRWDGDPTTISVTDGTSEFSVGLEPTLVGGSCFAFLYLPASVATGSPTYTYTLGAARTYRTFAMLQFRPSAAATFGGIVSNSGNGTAASSGNLVVSGSDILAIGGLNAFNQATSSNHSINGVAADGALTPQYAALWHKTFSENFTGAASASLPNSDTWGALLAYFRIGDSVEGVDGDLDATESGDDEFSASGATASTGIRLTLRDTDTGALAADLEGLIVSVRATSDAGETLASATDATTDEGGVLELASGAIGDIGDYVYVTVEKSDNSIVAAYRVQVVDLNA